MVVFTRIAKTEQHSEEAWEQVKKVAREGMGELATVRAGTEAVNKAEREVEEKAEREAEKVARVETKKVARLVAEKEAMEQTEREAKEKLERDEDERSRRENEAQEKAEREAKEREEQEKKALASNKTQTAWGSAERNDCPRKTSASQKEQKNEWANTLDMPSTEREGPSIPAPIFTSAASGLFDLLSTGKKDSPGGAEVELRTPVTKQGKNPSRNPSNLPEVATPTETADAGKPGALKDLNTSMSARISVSSRSENGRWTNAEQGPSPTELAAPTFSPELGSDFESFTNTALSETPTTPIHWPAPSPTPARQSPVPTATPPAPPAKTEPEKPLSLWDRKKLKVASPPAPAPASGLFSGGDGANFSGVWGDASGGGNVESIAMPAIVGDRQSGDRQTVFTDTARDRSRANQRGNVVEGLLGSSAARRRKDSAQSQAPVKPVPKPSPAPAPTQQGPGGWGPWGSSLLTTIASTIDNPDRSSSPEPASVKPKIGNSPRGFTPNQPPKKGLAQ